MRILFRYFLELLSFVFVIKIVREERRLGIGGVFFVFYVYYFVLIFVINCAMGIVFIL